MAIRLLELVLMIYALESQEISLIHTRFLRISNIWLLKVWFMLLQMMIIMPPMHSLHSIDENNDSSTLAALIAFDLYVWLFWQVLLLDVHAFMA